ncbi:MAG: SDR family NAD(P)-dependent oxidoreductase [Kiritimatiellia bacterium]
MIRSAYPHVRRCVLVTGCSSGIGLATAEVLRLRGWHVIPTARHDADISMLFNKGFKPVRLDLADASSVEKAVAAAVELSEGGIGALVNNAGVAQYGAVEDLTRTALERQFAVNTIGVQDLTNRLIPHFRAQGGGRIINVSSVYGRVTAPMVGAYCASKYAMEALSDAMRVELRAEGIAVCLIEPGPILSEFRNKSADHSTAQIQMDGGRYGEKYRRRMERAKKPQQQDFFTKPPEAVAIKIAHALEVKRPGSRYCVTIPAYAGAFLRRFAPDCLLDRLLVNSARV